MYILSYFKLQSSLTIKFFQAYELWKNEEGTEFFDPSLDDSDRPAVLEILTMLNNETANIKVPRKPAFSVKSDEDECIPEVKICSVNDATITQLIPR